MNRQIYSPLQIREIFHLEFLRLFGKKVRPDYYALKGGVNLRLFFKSIRYSEDIDLDIQGVRVDALRDIVMRILSSVSFQESLNPFGIGKIIPPDIIKAKQTQTTQRFKVHLISHSGEDLFTKIEFSRRGIKGEIDVAPVSEAILRLYKSPPLIVSHYAIKSAITHKIEALSLRAVVQARDIFDLFFLASQYKPVRQDRIKLGAAILKKAYENIFTVTFEQFRDAVLSYLAAEDQELYNASSLWDKIRLNVADFIKEVEKNNA